MGEVYKVDLRDLHLETVINIKMFLGIINIKIYRNESKRSYYIQI